MSNLTDAERAKIEAVNGIVPDIYETVESILAARLAGAGAQVTEAAKELRDEVVALYEDCDRRAKDPARDEASRKVWSQVASWAFVNLNANPVAAAHMGTGQSEAIAQALEDWADELDKPPYDLWAAAAVPRLRARAASLRPEGDNE